MRHSGRATCFYNSLYLNHYKRDCILDESIQSGQRTPIAYLGIRLYRVLSFGEHLVMLMLRAYMDESGQAHYPETKVVSVCGAVSTLVRWEAFEAQWASTLTEYGIEWFHMREFAHSEGQFKSWKGDEKRRRALLARLLEIMNNNIEGYMAGSMPVSVFNDLLPEQREKLIDPYYPCFFSCLTGAAMVAEKYGPDEMIETFYADLPKFKGHSKHFYDECFSRDAPLGLARHLGPITLNVSPQKVLPLQAADIVAYEVNHLLTDGAKGKGWVERWPLSQIKDKMLIVDVHDRKTIAERFGF